MTASVPSLKVAVMGADEAAATKLCQEAAQGDVLVPANFNAPGQIVVSGSKAACERVVGAAAAAGAEVEEQLAVDLETRERFNAGARGGALQFDRTAFGERLRKERERRFERRACRAANQAFVAKDRAVLEIDDRLEHGGQLTPGDQLLDTRRSGSGGRAKLHGMKT